MADARAQRRDERGVSSAARETPYWADLFEVGAAAGGTGGLLMLAWWMTQAAATGYGALFPLNLVGATFRGPEALVGGASVRLYGLLLYAVTAVLFGTMFSAAVTRKTRLASSLVAGIAYGLLILLLMNYVVLPYANPIMRQRVIGDPGGWFFSHVAFGLGVGLAPFMKRRLIRRRDPGVRG